MAFTAITAFLSQRGEVPKKPILSFVLAGGCNLSCAHCAVKRRSERQQRPTFFAEEYQRFVINAGNDIGGLAIVGDEPLLPEVWPVTRAILSVGNDLSLPTALVTNGTYLHQFAEELGALPGVSILVSVDGGEAFHDSSRGRVGTYSAVRRGLQSAAQQPGLAKRVTIASTLHPHRSHLLEGLPADLMKPLGIHSWALSPLLKFDHQGRPAVHPTVMAELPTTLPRLFEKGRAAGLDVFVDDGLRLISQYTDTLCNAGLAFRRPKERSAVVVRMRPDGACSVHDDQMTFAQSSDVRWDGRTNARDFLAQLFLDRRLRSLT